MSTLLARGQVSLTRLLDAVRDDAARRRVPARVAWSLAALPLAGGIAIAATVVHPPLFIWILRDDHPVEWIQFALCLLTAIVAALAARVVAGRREWLVASAFGLLAVGSFLLAAEEISWGQRVFAFATPSGLATINDQAEFNLHNMSEGYIEELTRLVQLLIGLGGTVLPFVVQRDVLFGRMRPGPAWLGPGRPVGRLLAAVSPPLFLVPAFAYAFAYRTLRFAVPVDRTPDAAIALTEWAEASLYLGLAGLAVFAHAAARQPVADRRGTADAVGGAQPLTRAVLGVMVGVTVLTVIFAVVTMSTGMVPGNAT